MFVCLSVSDSEEMKKRMYSCIVVVMSCVCVFVCVRLGRDEKANVQLYRGGRRWTDVPRGTVLAPVPCLDVHASSDETGTRHHGRHQQTKSMSRSSLHHLARLGRGSAARTEYTDWGL